MTWPAATRAAHLAFCTTEGWAPVRESRGRTGTHHRILELFLADGRTLRARISHPPDRTTYGASMWAHILRDQLAVSPQAFWACVHDGEVPERGERRPSQGDTLPASLVAVLLNQVGLAEADVRMLTRAEAIARVNEFWTSGR